jgi:hypothetical protein
LTHREQILAALAAQTPEGWTPFKGHGFYSEKSASRYGIYSTGIDRFILIDKFDLWITLTTAKLLSSKIPTTVFCLKDDVPQYPAGDTLFLTIANKSVHQSESQTPTLSRLGGTTSVIDAGPPIDYVSNEQIEMLARLQRYAEFVQKTLYAVKIANAICNPDDHQFFASLLNPTVSDSLVARADHTVTASGILQSIQHILYLSMDIKQATREIDLLWQETRGRNESFRTIFYNLSGLTRELITNPIQIPDF